LEFDVFNFDAYEANREPALKETHNIPASKLSQFRRHIFHTCLQILLEPIKTIQTTGIAMWCNSDENNSAPNANKEMFLPILQAYSGDIPEILKVS